MQDLIRPDASFTPRELFARMQGAWFKPRLGSMWQENTGVTATTSGGQTIGLLLDQSQQAQLGTTQVANGDFSDGTTTGWFDALNSPTIANVNSRLRITSDSATSKYTGYNLSVTAGSVYEISVGYYINVDFTLIALGNTGVNDLFQSAPIYSGSGTYIFRYVATATRTIKLCLRVAGTGYNEFDNISVRQILGNHASQATAANRPTLQYNGTLPLIRSDSTDVLTATLPAINVRRNLLTYSENLSNAVWVNSFISNGSRVNGSLSVSGAEGYAYIRQIVIPGATFTLSFDATCDTTLNNVPIRAGGTTAIAQLVDFVAGVTKRVIFSGIPYTSNNIDIGLDARDAVVPGGTNATGYVVTLNRVQLEVGSVATDYQKITDWTSEAYSSSGSTYFSTPSGMSCLHNQSIGTTYNLPALQTDIYGTVITPARLAPPLEQRLALYMHRLAGLSDADFFWQEQATDGMTGQLLADDNDTILLRA